MLSNHIATITLVLMAWSFVGVLLWPRLPWRWLKSDWQYCLWIILCGPVVWFCWAWNQQ